MRVSPGAAAPTVHWFCVQPTPYNSFLFDQIAKRRTQLVVHYRHAVLPRHPWHQGVFGRHDYRVMKPSLGVDWHSIRLALAEDALFVVAGWNDTVLVSLLGTLALRGRRFAVWTDTPVPHGTGKGVMSRVVRRLVLKIIFRRAMCVLATGRPGVDAARAMGSGENKTVNFPFFVALPQLKKRRSTEGPMRLAWIGQVVERKRVDVVIRAVAASRRRGAECVLVVAGDGGGLRSAKLLASELSVVDRVSFVGWLEPEAVSELLDESDALVHTAEYDPFPVVVLEAMAHGRPVLGSAASGSVLDRVSDGRNGFIHQAGDAETLAGHLMRLSANKRKLLEMGEAARATAELWPVERGVRFIEQLAASSSSREAIRTLEEGCH